MVIFLHRFDQQVIHRKPDRASPIGVSAKHARIGFARKVAYRKLRAVETKLVAMATRDNRTSIRSAPTKHRRGRYKNSRGPAGASGIALSDLTPATDCLAPSASQD